MTLSEELFPAWGYCAFMLILMLLYKWFPPKKINYIYGYRTRKSMRTQETWVAANWYGANISVKMCLYSFLFPPLIYFIHPEYTFLGTIFANLLLILSGVWFTERYLDQHFDRDGNPK